MNKEAVCALIRNEEGLFLAVSRKDDPTAFGLPGGKVDEEEYCTQALVREVKEETGYTISNSELKFWKVCKGDVNYFCYGFVCQCDSSQEVAPISPKETGVVKWVTREVLEAGPFGEYNKAFFERVL